MIFIPKVNVIFAIGLKFKIPINFEIQKPKFTQKL